MKLIIIYGPPAVGKLTVAKELKKITNFKIFHNHMTVDLIEPFIKFGGKTFWKYVEKIRRELFKMAAKENINLIFTFCYVKKLDDKNISKIIEIIEKNNGKTYFVKLSANKEKIYERVKDESRKSHGKIKSTEKLKTLLKTEDFFSQIPHKKSLVIDNTNLSAKQTAEKIKKELGLK